VKPHNCHRYPHDAIESHRKVTCMVCDSFARAFAETCLINTEQTATKTESTKMWDECVEVPRLTQ